MSTAETELPEDAPEAAATLDDHPRVHRTPATLPARAPRRVVSLVPSLSEAVVVLGQADRLVGVTEYCVHPAEAFRTLPRLGGTKDADVDAIAACAPDLVLANQEENTPRVVRKLAERGIDVWVTYPRTVREGAELLSALAERLEASADHHRRHVAPVLEALERAESRVREADAPGPRTFCPIWRDPWMTIGRDTYIHDLITLCGGTNVFAGPAPTAAAEREGASDPDDATATDARAPDAVAAARRYPIVEWAAIEAAAPEVILLPDEPYAFAEKDAAELAGLDCPAARDGRIHPIDGTLVSWYGPRIAEAIRVLAPILARS